MSGFDDPVGVTAVFNRLVYRLEGWREVVGLPRRALAIVAVRIIDNPNPSLPQA
jgi:hypothetical protein